MKIALVGATGFIGCKILAEAVSHGHPVTAICRLPENLPPNERIRATYGEVGDTATLAREFQGHDAIIHAYAPRRDPDVVAFVNAALQAGDSRLETLSSYAPKDAAANAA